MKAILLLTLCGMTLSLTGCKKSTDQEAQQSLDTIVSLYDHGYYQQALDSIAKLRVSHPQALKARREALRIWQEASLALTRQDIAHTDSALQQAQVKVKRAGSIAAANNARALRDSLQIRYDALCQTVRAIKSRQKQ